MPKMEIEFTTEQMEKIKILESKDITVGEAIELLFEMQEEALSQIAEQKHDDGYIDKIKDTAMDYEIKEALLKKQYEENETYDMTVHEARTNIKWSDYFKL